MKESTELRIMFWFTVIYLTVFTILAFFRKNYEFLYYTVILSIIIWVIVLYYKKMQLTKHIILSLIILGVMHIMGGNVHLEGIRLYDYWLIQGIFRYDHLVHSFGTFIATFIVYSLLNPYLDKRIKHNSVILALLLISIAMGLGAFNELIELGAVIFFGAHKQIGDYLNNAFDLFFNLVGSLIASIYIVRYSRKKK
jgi:uncharacterized membrane protein YjdF